MKPGGAFREGSNPNLTQSVTTTGAVATALPASDRQRRIHLSQTTDPAGTDLNVSASYRLRGEIDPQRFTDAVAAVGARHQILHTVFRHDAAGDLLQIVDPRLTPAVAVYDLTDLAEQARSLRLEVLAQREFGRPFTLGAEAPLRLSLIRTGPADHVLLLVAHHIAWDDGSAPVFLAELTAAYILGVLLVGAAGWQLLTECADSPRPTLFVSPSARPRLRITPPRMPARA